jgi:3-hydroxy-9,10-secoandrosta-1,3,5(10)-triene-9,17-dione monooxygenase
MPLAESTTTIEEPTGEEILARAVAMRERLRELQSVHAELGTYSPEIHEAFTEARLYDILRPKRYGGLELGLQTFFRVAAELSRADPGVGWSYELGASHAYQFSSYFPEESQAEAYEAYPFVAASRAFPLEAFVGPVDGGYLLTGRWDYNSGCTYSSHFMPAAPIANEAGELVPHMFILPRRDYTVLDDWGHGRTIGLGATSSNSITIDHAFVPHRNVMKWDFKDYRWSEHGGTPGYRLLGNPTYLGRTTTMFIAGLAVTQVGNAYAALDEYERLMHERGTSFPPRMPRTQSTQYQQWFGQIQQLADSASALLHATVRDMEERGVTWAAGGPEFTPEEDIRLRGQAATAARIAVEAVDLAFSTAGSTSSGMTGTRLAKAYQDAGFYKTHIGAQYDVFYGSQGRVGLGLPAGGM